MPEYGNVKLAENEQEYLLLELFPNVATTYLKGVRAAEYEAKKPAVEEVKEAAEEAAPVEPITGPTIDAPMGGKVVEIKVKVGDKVKKRRCRAGVRGHEDGERYTLHPLKEP